MSAAARDALERGLAWLARLDTPPGFEARADGHPPVTCEAPYAVALVASAWRYGASLQPAPAALEGWLAAACDPDGMVRFFGPMAPIIGPDLDDTAMVWAERRALTGWSPPVATLEATRASKVESGAFDTWPASAGPTEVDAVVNANILAMLAADGEQDDTAHRFVAEALGTLGGPSPVACPYYPDLAMLVVCARRAEDLGAAPLPYPAPEALSSRTLVGDIARALLGDGDAVAALLTAQEADGAWPWAPLFVGGDENVFPDGQQLPRPWYGARAASTALAVMALARSLDLALAALAPSRGSLPAGRVRREVWESLVGPLGHGLALVRSQEASKIFPELDGPGGRLRLDIAPRNAMPQFFRGGACWALGYRGDRSPSAAEVAAMERLVARLDATGPAAAKASGPTGIRCQADDASDLAERLAHVDHDSGPVHVRLPPTLHVPSALPHLADALRSGPELRFQGLPYCALPWPEELVTPSPPHGPRRAAAPACDRCVTAHTCAGPAGGALRPRTSDGPWVPLRRAAESWREVWGYPSAASFEPIEATLHDLQAGPLAGVRWSIVLVADVAGGRVDPTFRVDAFHGHRDGEVVPGRSVLERLPTLDSRVRDALAPAGETCPVHPAYSDGPAGAHLGAYADTGHLDTAAAWAVLREGLAAASMHWTEPAPEVDGVLGYAVGPAQPPTATPTLDVYVTVPGLAGPLAPPEEVADLAAGSPCVATLRLTGGRLTLRKWDVSWWRAGRDDDALLRALGAEGAEGAALERWLHAERYGLHPTTFGWRDGGRRIYLRVC